MAQLQNITVNNGTSDVLLTVTSKDGLNVIWTGPGDSASIKPRLQLQGQAVKTGSNRRLTTRLVVPTEITDINGGKSIVNNTLKLDLSVNPATTISFITELRNMLSNLLKDNIIIDAIDNGNLPY